MKWVVAICFSAVFLTGCGSDEGSSSDGWTDVGQDVSWKCVGSDKVYDGFRSMAVSPNSPDCLGG